MQIHQLRYFCAIARTGSFTRAAEQEHLAQPSLSQQVRKVEDELGTRLFDRLVRSVRLTSFGETFLPRAEAILRQVEDAKHEIEEMAGVERGKVVVGSIPTVAPYFLPGCLASFSRKFPDIQVSVVEELTSELLERVQDGTLDLALLALPIPGGHFVCQELFRERLYLVVPESHRLSSHSMVPGRPGEFHSEPPTDPDVNLSIHPARATQRRLPPSIKTRSSSGFPLTPPRRGWPAPFAPRELPRFLATTKQCAPGQCIGTFGLVGSPLVPFPFASPTRFSSSARKP